jgi:hypothetical protein
MADEISIVFQPADEEGLFRAVRIEEDVEGHLRRSRDDLSRVVVEPIRRPDEALYRILVGGEDDVAGHAGEGLFVYLMRKPPPRGGRVASEDDVEGHVSRPQDKPEHM